MALSDLAGRELDLVAYDRVIADMKMLSGGQAINIVHMCRDAARRDCEQLRKIVDDLESAFPP
jgi:hypothetical protein